MAFNDTLFQLGMDLTRSSTAQKEDLNDVVRVAQHSGPVPQQVKRPETRGDYQLERDGSRYAGQHLIIDLFGARRLDDAGHVEDTLRRCVDAAGATLVHMHLHPLAPQGGVAGVAVLEESHISIHSWPEKGYAALDVFMSGAADPDLMIPVLKRAFGASEVVIKTHLRGEDRAAAVEAPRRAKRSQPLRAVRKAKAA